jgi:hypothetical protein
MQFSQFSSCEGNIGDTQTAYKGLLVVSGSNPAFVTCSEFKSSPLMHIRVTGPRKANYVKHYSNSVLQVLIKRISTRSARIEMTATAKLGNRPLALLDYELDAAHNIYWPGLDPIANFCGGCDELSRLPIVIGWLGDVSFLWESDTCSSPRRCGSNLDVS